MPQRMPLTAIKSTVNPGNVLDVTNHYIKREDHSAFGTTRRRIAKVTSSSVYMVYTDAPAGGEPRWPAFTWPKASQVEMDPDGTICLHGGGCNQKPDELFLTLVPVKDTAK